MILLHQKESGAVQKRVLATRLKKSSGDLTVSELDTFNEEMEPVIERNEHSLTGQEKMLYLFTCFLKI